MKKILAILTVIFGISCGTSHKAEAPATVAVPSARAIIYKTSKDYTHNVPILLSDDKTSIISYPAPADLLLGDNLRLPILLNKGYLLDNKGIGVNVAFLSYTYEEYSKLSEAPSIEALFEKIIDADPITEMWDCGYISNYQDLEKEINQIIKKNDFKNHFKNLK